MDFLTAPPEVTSALIHSGPGAGSLIEASDVWRQLGIELEESVGRHASVLSSLNDSWTGPSSAAMVQAAQPYLSWLRTTAQQCQQLSSSVRAAAAAFESARGAVVVPVAVGANRTRLAQLVATNWFGNNLAAIAATEGEYEGMWANNTAAMYRYQAATAQALALPQFSSPPPIADPAAAAAQAGAVPAAASAQSAIGDFLTNLLSTPGGFNPQAGWFGLLNTYANQFIAGGIPINLLSYIAQTATAQAVQGLGGDVGQGLAEGEAALGAATSEMVSAIRAVGSATTPTAAVGVGVSIGKLTAPPTLVGMLPATQTPVQLAAAVSPLSPLESGSPTLPPLMPPRVAAGNRRRREGRDYDDIEFGLEIKGTFMTRPPSAG